MWHLPFCNIPDNGLGVPSGDAETFPLPICSRSWKMVCLSTGPLAGTVFMSGKSCCNWLFCRSSRISSKLSKSLLICCQQQGQLPPINFVSKPNQWILINYHGLFNHFKMISCLPAQISLPSLKEAEYLLGLETMATGPSTIHLCIKCKDLMT